MIYLTDLSEYKRFSQNLKDYVVGQIFYGIVTAQNYFTANQFQKDTQCKGHNNRYKCRKSINFIALMKSIKLNTFMDYYREMSLRLKMDSDNILPVKENIFSSNEIETNLFKEKWKYALQELDEKYRRPLELSSYGFNYSEISEQLGVSISCIKSRLCIARQKLRKSYKNNNLDLGDIAS